ncbi:hypothetical protein LguiA_000532 [Lonicera macranthoides]
MESFVKTCKDEKQIDVESKGFETWKNMSNEERRPYALLAQQVNSAYTKALLAEADNFSMVEDEADSAEVGRYDKKYKAYDCYDDYVCVYPYARPMLDPLWISGNSC